MTELKIEGDYIQLDKALKFANLVQTGGHAKMLIQEGLVKVNGVIEYRRGKKLRPGDIIQVEGEQILIKN
ncbi:RNA-binding S4 domain-containing protein [Crassaminicella thermophila]|uniref:RNA-binding S4 domain-containing protein n=1 Tax=Crassaminicella thermophila TaxID=2599308 RepID=A0A5C0S8A0_CRATE|nr:RNA-binding S4 domain-containing protein [Crassaminicella thermophila]QEK10885.1 RNA-binding S4 domain-containing protein [Crassaminicella thermophila]